MYLQHLFVRYEMVVFSDGQSPEMATQRQILSHYIQNTKHYMQNKKHESTAFKIQNTNILHRSSFIPEEDGEEERRPFDVPAVFTRFYF